MVNLIYFPSRRLGGIRGEAQPLAGGGRKEKTLSPIGREGVFWRCPETSLQASSPGGRSLGAAGTVQNSVFAPRRKDAKL